MHDPTTVAFEIKTPWRRKSSLFPEGYRRTWVTIWHHDPESDGSDDSCGWSYPKISDADWKLAAELAKWEQGFPHYFAGLQRVTNPKYPELWSVSPGDAAAIILDLWCTIAWRIDRRELSPRLAVRALRLGASGTDGFASTLTASTEEEQTRGLALIIRSYRQATRPWYRHPKWHIHHWRIQLHALQTFKRWAFTRCARCGGRFKWNETGYSGWNSDGPQWFRSEDLTHMQCGDQPTTGTLAGGAA